MKKINEIEEISANEVHRLSRFKDELDKTVNKYKFG